jgi:DNA modification methylase
MKLTWPEDYINKILCGDCLHLMKGIPDKAVDLVLTDPPYGIKMDKGFEGFGGFGGFGKPIARRQYEDVWDNGRPDKIYFDEIFRISKKALIFGGNFFADMLPQGRHWIVWDKLNTMPSFGDCELIWTNIDRKSVKKITQEYNGLLGKEDLRVHPTQKPLELIRKILLT